MFEVKSNWNKKQTLSFNQKFAVMARYKRHNFSLLPKTMDERLIWGGLLWTFMHFYLKSQDFCIDQTKTDSKLPGLSQNSVKTSKTNAQYMQENEKSLFTGHPDTLIFTQIHCIWTFFIQSLLQVNVNIGYNSRASCTVPYLVVEYISDAVEYPWHWRKEKSQISPFDQSIGTCNQYCGSGSGALLTSGFRISDPGSQTIFLELKSDFLMKSQ
jgi:hypothetical protein